MVEFKEIITQPRQVIDSVTRLFMEYELIPPDKREMIGLFLENSTPIQTTTSLEEVVVELAFLTGNEFTPESLPIKFHFGYQTRKVAFWQKPSHDKQDPDWELKINSLEKIEFLSDEGHIPKFILTGKHNNRSIVIYLLARTEVAD